MESFIKLAGYGILFACVTLMVFTDFSGRRAALRSGRALILRYPLGIRLFCGLLLLFAVLWAFALADVSHMALFEGVAIWSLLGIPIIAMCVESFGKKIVIVDATVRRSYFGCRPIIRSTDSVCEVVRKEDAKVFCVRFHDGSSLWLPFPMIGSLEAAMILQKRPNQPPQQQRP